MPQGNQVFIAGGDNWTGTGTTNTGNNNSNMFNYSSNTLTRNNNMNRPRWYSSSIALLNGEIYIQGGSGGTDRPEIRGTNGVFRLLTGADTSGLDFMFPRNFVAPDGRVFGYDSNGRMYYVNTSGTGSVTLARQFSGPTGSDSSAAMFRPGKILQFGGNSNDARVIDITGGTPVVTTTQLALVAAAAGQCHDPRRRQGARDRRQRRLERDDGRQLQRRDLESDDGTLAASAPPRPRARLYHSTAVLMPDASVLVAGGGAPGPQNNTNIEIYYPPYLYNAAGGFATRPVINRCAVDHRHRRDVRCRHGRHRGHQPRRADQDGLGLAQLEHGAALHRADVSAERRRS